VSARSVARLMKAGGVVVRIRRRFRVTTNSKHGHPVAPNLVARRFGVAEIGANRCWASDITYIDTQQGWCILRSS
jgi:transposase InsO family protein